VEYKGRRIKMNKKGLIEFVKEEDGMGTVEIILIIVVLIGLVIIFKEQLNDLVNDIFDKITKQAKKI
jgi:Flp pilus assembly pilin Flp